MRIYKDSQEGWTGSWGGSVIIWERIQDQESLKKFLEPSLEDLHDPYLLHDMDKAVERIRQAIEEGENILIYGDYDADGMTSASIVKESLEQLGAECRVYPAKSFYRWLWP